MTKFNLNNFILNKWYHFTYNNDDIKSILNLEEYLLIPSVESFIKNVIEPLIKQALINKDLRISIITKFFDGTSYRSITSLKTFKIENINELSYIVTFFYSLKFDENYNLQAFKTIVFNFRILSHDLTPNIITTSFDKEVNDFKQESF